MPSDFSTQMAQMLAQARPQQAPAQHRVGMIGGGGGQGIVNNSTSMGEAHQTMMKADIDVGQIAKLLGWKPDEYLVKTTEQLAKAATDMSPEQYEAFISSPPIQRFMEKSSKTGQSLAYFNPQKGRYDMALPSEPARMKSQVGMSPTSMAAGYFGQQPREQFIEADQRSREPSGYNLLTPEQRQAMAVAPLRKAEADIGATGALKDQREATTEQTKLETTLLPEKTRAVVGQAEAAAESSRAHASYYKAQEENILSQGSKEQQLLNKQAVAGFDTTFRALNRDVFNETSTTVRRAKLGQVAGLVLGQIGQVKALNDGDPSLALGPVHTLVDMMGKELVKMPMPSQGLLSLSRPSVPKEDARQVVVFLNDQTRLMQELREKAPKPMVESMVNNVVEITKRLPLDDDTAPELIPTLTKWLNTAKVIDPSGKKAAVIEGILRKRAPEWFKGGK